MAGWRAAGPERRPSGRPGDRPQGFGASAGVSRVTKELRKRLTRPGGREGATVGTLGPLPGEALLVDGAAGQTELGVRQQHQPGPAIGLLSVAHARSGPS